ncbi:hypothetical protein [Burkholderia contaminans]|nr:hypothetical protein [Burkholderia contaminans]
MQNVFGRAAVVPLGWKNRRMGDYASKRSIADINMTAARLCFVAAVFR